MALGASRALLRVKTKREDELLTLRRKQDTADPLMGESDTKSMETQTKNLLLPMLPLEMLPPMGRQKQPRFPGDLTS